MAEFNLVYKVSLNPRSQKIYDMFIEQNKERKEVNYVDVFIVLSQAAFAFKDFRLANGKKLNNEEQFQIMMQLFTSLVENEANGFEMDPRIAEIIRTILDARDGKFTIDLGKMGCWPCGKN